MIAEDSEGASSHYTPVKI